MSKSVNKRKIVNDPVYGFITIPFDILFDLMEHPWFQRLRRIRQLGMTNYVYPGATHTRFQHALGAMYLMGLAIAEIRSKGQEISEEEAEASCIAILLHDIGHGPFSHALENSIVEHIRHEDLSLMLMEQLNQEFEGRLSLAIKIFQNQYSKRFLHQLVASQLDMDRLDYLKRDSFYTGVSEGVIGSDRIIKMLRVVDDELVVEAKGIYSIEKFLIARRLMYWQVYLHKTVLSAENLIVKMLRRAKYLADRGESLFASPALDFFLRRQVNQAMLTHLAPDQLRQVLDNFVKLDDTDILLSAKEWQYHSDRLLVLLSSSFINRQLFKLEMQKMPFEQDRITSLRQLYKTKLAFDDNEIEYLVFSDSITNYLISSGNEPIKILLNDGKLMDIKEASDIIHYADLTKDAKKYFLCYPK